MSNECLEFLLLNIWTTLDCLYNCIELNCLETCRILDGNVEITVHTTEHCSHFNNTPAASLSLCIILQQRFIFYLSSGTASLLNPSFEILKRIIFIHKTYPVSIWSSDDEIFQIKAQIGFECLHIICTRYTSHVSSLMASHHVSMDQRFRDSEDHCLSFIWGIKNDLICWRMLGWDVVFLINLVSRQSIRKRELRLRSGNRLSVE